MPWDNRTALGAGIESLREATVREHLHDVGSALLDEPNAATIYRRMRITAPVNEHEVPRNVGLLFFSDDPERWCPGARIAVVQFAADRAGEVLDERVFRGPLPAQLRACLRHLEGLSQTHIRKQRDRSRVRGWVSYPIQAFREVLVNAVYHRSYRPDAYWSRPRFAFTPIEWKSSVIRDRWPESSQTTLQPVHPSHPPAPEIPALVSS